MCRPVGYSSPIAATAALVAFGVIVVLWGGFAFRHAGLKMFALVGLALGALLLVNAAPLTLAPAIAWIAWHARTSISS